MYKRVFFPGRFQPVHKGHVEAIKWLLGQASEVVIGVTAAQYNFTMDNPFTAGERIEMLKLALGELWSRLYVVPLDNIPDNWLWLYYVETRTPRFDAVATNNSFVELLAKNRGYPVLHPPLVERDVYQGRRIRELMLVGEGWRELVPENVARYIDKIKGVGRLRDIHSSERVITPRY